jgi:iron complex outermembrane receptor protein
MRAIPENFKGARVWGGELEALVQHRYFSVSASYTLNFSENGDPRSQGKELPYRPRHRFHGRGSFNWGRFEAHVDADAQTELWQNRNNTSQLPGRVRVDVGASVILDRGLGLSLHADLRNLFESWDRDLYGYSLPGRAVYVAVRFDSSQRSTP